jgi:1-acyl-sn-glycerol-3-phosphate acyltransferase
MRASVFNVLFYATIAVFVLVAAALSLLPRPEPLRAAMRTACRTIRALMQWVMGIPVEVRGTPPAGRPVIIASKHQSWADGFLMMAILGDINFIIGSAVAKFPLVPRIVAKSGATMVNSPGDRSAGDRMDAALARAADDPRPFLIYPEGNLAAVGEAKRYRKGVHVMYETLDRPVVPVATNTGLRWPKNEWMKFPGPAVIEFLDPIPPGLPRDAFLPRLMTTIEARTRALEAEGRAAREPDTETVS